MVKGLGFGLLQSPDNVSTADYKSAGSHQAENLKYLLVDTAGAYNEIHTVTIGKTFYMSLFVFSSSIDQTIHFATGGSGSEVNVMKAHVIASTGALILQMATPTKFQSGTRLSCKIDASADSHFIALGWEE